MSPDQEERVNRLLAGTERNCSDQRRSDTRTFIAEALQVIRHQCEKDEASRERITALRQALDDRNTMMDNAERESSRIKDALSSDNLELWDENTYLREAVARQSIELSKALR